MDPIYGLPAASNRSRKRRVAGAFHLVAALGQGSYNCVLSGYRTGTSAGEDEQRRQLIAIRLALLDHVDAAARFLLPACSRQPPPGSTEDFSMHDYMIMRGLATVHLFQNFAPQLGPALVREESPFLLLNRSYFPHYFENPEMICHTVRDAMTAREMRDRDYMLAVQQLELLSPLEDGDKGPPEMWRAQHLFILMWFLVAGERLFEFQHHDLKPDNVMLRKHTEDWQTYHFELHSPGITPRGGAFFALSVRSTPVILDLDFSTTRVSTRHPLDDRLRMGSYLYAPPDVMLQELQSTWYEEAWRGNTGPYFHSAAAYDWWSLGAMALPWYTGVSVEELGRVASAAFRERIVSQLPVALANKSNNTHIRTLIRSLFVALLLPLLFDHGDPLMDQMAPYYPGLHRFYHEERSRREFAAFRVTDEWRAARRAVELLRNRDPGAFAIFHRTFAWSPTYRIFEGRPERYFGLNHWNDLRLQQASPQVKGAARVRLDLGDEQLKTRIRRAMAPLDEEPCVFLQEEIKEPPH